MISRRSIRVHLEANLTEPLHKLWSHTVVYYKYSSNVYRKFPIDGNVFCFIHFQFRLNLMIREKLNSRTQTIPVWEDFCGWFNGSSKNYFIDQTLGVLQNSSNLNHKCPFDGYVYIKNDNITFNSFKFEQFIPSGRYRIEANMVEGYRGQWMATMYQYLTVSDVRVDVF